MIDRKNYWTYGEQYLYNGTVKVLKELRLVPETIMKDDYGWIQIARHKKTKKPQLAIGFVSLLKLNVHSIGRLEEIKAQLSKYECKKIAFGTVHSLVGIDPQFNDDIYSVPILCPKGKELDTIEKKYGFGVYEFDFSLLKTHMYNTAKYFIKGVWKCGLNFDKGDPGMRFGYYHTF